MTVENNRDLRGLMRIGQICGFALQHMLAHVEPGMTTKELDLIGAEFLKKQGAVSAPILAYNYPGYTCISLNDEAAHAVPGDRIIQPGDLVNVDVSAVLEGYWGDTGATMIVPPALPEYQRLCEHTKFALEEGIKQARSGQPIYNIGRAIHRVAQKGGYNIIRELGGHGVGRHIHEKPSVPNYYTRRAKQRMKDGMVFTIEPFFTPGKGKIDTEPSDGWTLRTLDGAVSAQYEHTVIIDGENPIPVTRVQ